MNRYPLPVTVRMKRGFSGSSLSTCRILLMAPLMLLSVSTKTPGPQTFSTICSRVTEVGSALHQEEQDLHGNPLELDGAAGSAQLVGPQVELEVLAEIERGDRRSFQTTPPFPNGCALNLVFSSTCGDRKE